MDSLLGEKAKLEKHLTIGDKQNMRVNFSKETVQNPHALLVITTTALRQEIVHGTFENCHYNCLHAV